MTYPKRIPNYKAIDDAFGEKKEPAVEPPKDPAAPSEKPKDPPASGDAPEIHNTIKQAIKEARQNASSITRDERLYVIDEDVIGTPDEILEYAEINIDSASNGTVDSEGVQTAGDETTVKTKIEEEFAM